MRPLETDKATARAMALPMFRALDEKPDSEIGRNVNAEVTP
jgi:hypothetical protein